MAEKASAEAAEKAAIAEEELIKKLKTGGKITLAVLIVLAASYGIYKLTPKIKEWWISRKKKDQLATEDK